MDPHREHGVSPPMQCSHMLHWWQDNKYDGGKGTATAAMAKCSSEVAA